SMGFKAACEKAGPTLLEPIMRVEVTTPESFVGDVIGDLNARRGRVESMEPRSNIHVVKAFVPLAEMFGYATTVRSMSQGRASYSMEPSHYEPVPQSISEEIRKKSRTEPEAAGSRR